MKRLALLLLAASLALAGCYTNPVTGRKSLVLLSQGEELTLGAQSFQQIREKEKVSADPASNARVTRIGQRIAKAVGNELPDAKWEFVVFDSNQLNAFALPGGKVGVYTGLIKLAENDSELAIVMGHEIGHVIARHGAERMSEAMVISGVGALGAAAVEAKTGDAATRQTFELAYGGLTTIGRVLPHSRGNESEADRMGAIYAARAGYDPRASITFWQKMMAQKQAAGGAASEGKLGALLSTHPADTTRIADLKALMPSVLPTYEQNKGKFND
ncbi:M48 family metallopeptidase [Horticoccus sp. 23ND18S-11]|uniref:M48 family metallopeptidase n=1 Tax=Horticoccus sp. 23ND18S-11 TaxID=3391832 RepID=UPI0039C9EE26